MPQLGEHKYGNEIGRSQAKYVWAACEICGRERWVRELGGIPTRKRCMSCKGLGLHPAQATILKRRGEGNKSWKGGRLTENGYVLVKIYPEDPFYPMASKHSHHGYITEHRLVMACHLGRCLLSSEHVHHKDGIRDHNDLSNLELVSPSNHVLYNRMCADCELRTEIRLLRWQIKELTSALQERLRLEN